MNLRRLRWLTIVAPLAFLVALDLLRHEVFIGQLHTFVGSVALFAVVAAAVAAFSSSIFGAIQRLESRILAQNRQLSALNRIAAAATESASLQDLLDVSLDTVIEVMRTDAGVICLLDTDTEELVASCHRGISEELAQRIRRQKLSEDPVGSRVVKTGRPVVLQGILENPAVSEQARKEGFQAAVSAPLKSEGQVAGVLVVATRENRVFTPAETELLTNIGGQLGLAVRNAVLFTRAEQQNKELSALLIVARGAASSRDLGAILAESLDAALRVTSAESAEVWLVENHGDLTLACLRGEAPEAFGSRTRFRLGEGLPGHAAQTGQAITVHDLASDPRFLRPAVQESGFQTFYALPLRQRDHVVGVLGMAARSREALGSWSERRLLEGIGEQLAVAIENARLQQQVMDVAVLEERERIARELHDGLAQVLGYINTQTLAIRKLVAGGRTEEAQEHLFAMEEAAREVYADIREAIVGLRVLSPVSGGIIVALRGYSERYSEMAGVTVRVEANGRAESLKLRRSTEIQLLRIVQEALTNVRKHARARMASVSFKASDSGLRVEVADDGQGFDPEGLASRGWPRFGIQTMRERAQAIGGSFDIVSSQGEGTRVVVRVPILTPAEAADENLAGR